MKSSLCAIAQYFFCRMVKKFVVFLLRKVHKNYQVQQQQKKRHPNPPY